MYVIPNWTFTPNVGGYDQVVIPGIFSIEQFAEVENATKNTTLYTSTDSQHLGSIVVSDDGAQTTVLVWPSDPDSKATDQIRIIMYDPAPTGSGPTSNVAVTNWPASQNVNGTVNVGNEVEVKNDSGSPLAVSGTVNVGNFPAIQPVSGTVTANQGTSPWVVTGSITSAVSSFPATGTDAFGRLRVSNPYTLFDSSNRYAMNDSWTGLLTGGATASFNSGQGLVDLTVPAVIGSSVTRETAKVFSYQPGKSLLVMSTFVMSPATGLTQRIGYYGDSNGYYIQKNDAGVISFVERSLITGVVTNTPVTQSSWNVDPMNGTGPSGINLDFTKAQILWFDLEWLGVGTVRAGFVVNGVFYLAHAFQHANVINSTYITTACLPLRYELANVSSATGGTLKQICSTVISEGGYTLTGAQRSVGTPVTTPYALTIAGTYYPVMSLRLKTSKIDAISLLTGISLLGGGNNETYSWRVVSRCATAGGTWSTLSANSSVEYNRTGTSVTGGTVVASGFTSASNQGSPVIDIFRGSIFANQLERDGLTGTPYEIAIEVAGAGASQIIYASVDWEEITS